jgi:hypothetical protein
MKGEIMTEFKKFATQRIIIGLLSAAAVLWLIGTVLGLLGKSESTTTIAAKQSPAVHVPSAQKLQPSEAELPGKLLKADSTEPAPIGKESNPQPDAQQADSGKSVHGATSAKPSDHSTGGEKSAAPSSAAISHTLNSSKKKIPGVAFVTATIQPLSYELNDRFWGWRPNDILNFTDNVNSFQLGVLEVTRRTTVTLTERLSRTGSVESLNKNLERAMDWLMTKPDRYWFPSPESRYEDALDEIAAYRNNLENGAAVFYSRADTLLPLLTSYDNLLGSCDENLIKTKESNGEPVRWSRVDDYFYYAKGVASALETILEAVMEDFQPTLETRHGMEILHHAIASCKRATEIEPWLFITDSDYSGFLANHRANMAAPISHARFYIEVLISVLST